MCDGAWGAVRRVVRCSLRALGAASRWGIIWMGDPPSTALPENSPPWGGGARKCLRGSNLEPQGSRRFPVNPGAIGRLPSAHAPFSRRSRPARVQTAPPFGALGGGWTPGGRSGVARGPASTEQVQVSPPPRRPGGERPEPSPTLPGAPPLVPRGRLGLRPAARDGPWDIASRVPHWGAALGCGLGVRPGGHDLPDGLAGDPLPVARGAGHRRSTSGGPLRWCPLAARPRAPLVPARLTPAPAHGGSW